MVCYDLCHLLHCDMVDNTKCYNLCHFFHCGMVNDMNKYGSTGEFSELFGQLVGVGDTQALPIKSII